MAVTRREFLALASGLAGLWSCARLVRPEAGALEQRPLHRKLRSAGGATVLVLMPETPQTQAVWTGLSDELGGDFSLVALRVESRSSADVIARAVKEYEPSALVLMNNPTVAAYRAYLSSRAAVRGLPAVIVMTSFLDGEQLGRLGATGISYEVPLITAVTHLRRIVAAPVDRIGVVCRSPLAGFLASQRVLAQREQIRVVEVGVDSAPNDSELKRAIRQLKQESDALWLLNDDRLLTPSLIASGWLPGLNEKPWRPTIVGAGSLVSATQSLGTFAVLPDHTALGTQAAGLVFEISENDWKLPNPKVVYSPLSTTTTIDMEQVRERFPLQKDALAQVDHVVE
jgi:hypothetical protein